MTRKKDPTLYVVNRDGVRQGVACITLSDEISTTEWYVGDVYDGPDPEKWAARGLVSADNEGDAEVATTGEILSEEY